MKKDKRKKMLHRKALSLFLVLAMIVGVFPMSVFAEMKKANWDLKDPSHPAASTQFWPIPNNAKLVRTSNSSEPFRNISINFEGVYTNEDGREVIRTRYSSHNMALSLVWKRLLIKLNDGFNDVVDWEYMKQNGKGGIGMRTGNNTGTDDFTEFLQFAPIASSISGGKNTFEVSLNDAKLNGVGYSRNVPIDFVLKEGKSVKGLGEALIQMRIMNDNHNEIFTASTGDQESYDAYTWSTKIPTQLDYAVDTIPNIRGVDGSPYQATNIMVDYERKIINGKDVGLLTVKQRQQKGATVVNGFVERNYALRNSFDSAFKNVLMKMDKSGTIADVFLMNHREESFYPDLSTDTGIKNDKVHRILDSQINTKGKISYIEIASSAYNQTPGITTAVTANTFRDVAMNVSSTANQGFFTAIRYYVDPDKMEELMKSDGYEAFQFFNSYVMNNPSKSDHSEVKVNEFKTALSADQILAKGSELKITFPDKVGANAKFNLTIGTAPHSYTFDNAIKYTGGGIVWKPEYHKEYTINLPVGMTIKQGEPIVLRIQSNTFDGAQVKLNIGTEELVANDKQVSLLPMLVQNSSNYSSGSIVRTLMAPRVEEVFTDSTSITGHSYYPDAEVHMDTMGEKTKVVSASPEEEGEEVTIAGKTYTGYRFEYAGETLDAAKLEKDMPLSFKNKDIYKRSILSDPAVIEQVQAKVIFDLNGGDIEGVKDPVVKIAPLNENYKYDPETGDLNPAYKANGFEGDNLRKVDGVLADHNGEALNAGTLDQRLWIGKEGKPKEPTKKDQGKKLDLLGWSTKKMEGTPEELTKAWNKLEVADSAEKTHSGDNYKFTATSPIAEPLTVYAVWGSDELVIPYIPMDPSKPVDEKDKNIPTTDNNGKTIIRNEYVQAAFKVAPENSGTLTLGNIAEKKVISALVKKDTAWADIKMPTTSPASDYTFWYWSDAKSEKVENGQIRTAKFVKDGDEVLPEDKELPDGFHKVTVAKGEGIADDPLFGKTYAVKTNSKLAQDKFPTFKASENFKNPRWSEEKPWNVVITGEKTFTATAVSSEFNKDAITGMEFEKNPDKMSYTEGEKLLQDGLKIKLTDENGNTVSIGKDELDGYGVEVSPADQTASTVKDHNGKNFVAKVGELTANSPGTITVKDKETSAKPTIVPVVEGSDKVLVTVPEGTEKGTMIVTVTPKDGGETKQYEAVKQGPETYVANIPEAKAGDKVNASFTEEGKKPAKADELTVSEKEVSATPTIKEVAEESKTIEGTGVPGAKVVVTKDDTKIGETTVKDDKTWSIPVKEGVDLVKDQVIEAVQTEKGKKASEKASTTVSGKSDADKYTPIGKLQIVKLNAEVEAKDSIKNLSELPKNTKYEFEEPVLTDGVGFKSATVIVTYEDTSEESVDVVILVVDSALAVSKAPVINPVKKDDTEITGKGVPNSEITVVLENGKVISTNVEEDGTWTALVEKDDLKAGETVTAVQKETDKSYSGPATTVVKDASDKITDAPTINPVSEGDVKISGTAEKGADVTVILPNATKTVKADEKGNWTLDLPEGTTLKVGDTVKATAKTEGKDKSPETTTTVGPKQESSKDPKVNPVKPGEEAVSGEGVPGATITVTKPDGSTEDITVGDEGTWTVPIDPAKEGDKIGVVQTEDGKKPSDKVEITVEKLEPSKDPKVNPVKPGEEVVSGEGVPGATITVTKPDGSTEDIIVGDEGTWTVPIDPAKEGDKIGVVQTEDGKKPSDKVEITVEKEKVLSETPTLNPVKDNDTTISGTGVPGAEVVVTLKDGTEYKTKVDQDGKWTVDVDPKNLNPGETVTAVQTEDGKAASGPSTTDIKDSEKEKTQTNAPVMKPVAPSDEVITGSSEPNAVIKVVLPNGEEVNGKADDQGNWSVRVPDAVKLNKGDVIKATAMAEGKTESPEAKTSVGPITQNSKNPSINKVTDGDQVINGTGVAGATITVTKPDGKTINATVDKDGKWSVLTPSVKTGDKITAVQKENGKNESGKVEITVFAKESTPQSGSSTGSGSGSSSSSSTGSKSPAPDVEKIEDEDITLGKLNYDDHFAYIQGYPDGTVKPHGLLTREEVSAVFFRLLDKSYRESVRSNKNNFTDVNPLSWSNKHISTLTNAYVINGYPDGTFKPSKKVTRAELAAIASRFDKLEKGAQHSFTDLKGHWAEKYIASAVQKGWVKGYEDGTFKPDQEITRAEFVSFVNNVLNRHVKQEDLLQNAKSFTDLQDANEWYYCPMKAATNSYLYDIDSTSENNSNVIKYQKWTELIYPDIEM